MPEEFQPFTPSGPDPKWRYMWRIGPRPSNTRFQVSCIVHFFLARSFCVHYFKSKYSCLHGCGTIVLFHAGIEFWTCHTRRVPWVARNHGPMGIQDDSCNRGTTPVSFSIITIFYVAFWCHRLYTPDYNFIWCIFWCRPLLRWLQLVLACQRMHSLLWWNRYRWHCCSIVNQNQACNVNFLLSCKLI